MLRHSQFSFTKILKALQVLIFTVFWKKSQYKLTLPRRSQDVIFEHIFKNAFLYHFYFFNIDYSLTYRYVCKHAEENIKKSFYICIKFWETSKGHEKNVPRWRPHYDVLRTFRECKFNALCKFNTITFFKV